MWETTDIRTVSAFAEMQCTHWMIRPDRKTTLLPFVVRMSQTRDLTVIIIIIMLKVDASSCCYFVSISPFAHLLCPTLPVSAHVSLLWFVFHETALVLLP